MRRRGVVIVMAMNEHGRWFWLALAAANMIWLDGWIAPKVFAQPGVAPSASRIARSKPNDVTTDSSGPAARAQNQQDVAFPASPRPASTTRDGRATSDSSDTTQDGTNAALKIAATETREQVPASTRAAEEALPPPDMLLYFELGSYRLSARNRRSLRILAKALVKSGQQAFVDGHTDRIGKAVDNARLSARRSHAVVSTLEAYGVPPSQLKPRHFGEQRPVSNTSRSKNRRVEIVLLGAGGGDGAMR